MWGMANYLTYLCPKTGDTVQLNVWADSLDDVKFRTMGVEDCASCHQDHQIVQDDLGLGAEAPE